MLFTRLSDPRQAIPVISHLVKDYGARPVFPPRIGTLATYAKEYARRYPIIGFDAESKALIVRTETTHNVLFANDGSPVNLRAFKAALKTEAERLSQPFVKPVNPTFVMGFEIEGCVAPSVRDDLEAYVNDLYAGQATFDLDGSIRPRCQALEIVTPALPMDQAIETLEWLFGTLSILTDEGLFRTNATTGFHVNVSEAQSFVHPNRETRYRFAHGLMKRLDPQGWRKRFRRTANRYCWWTQTPESPADLHQEGEIARLAANAHDGWVDAGRIRHWRAVNTEHLDAAVRTNRRVEIRMGGGKDYHAKPLTLEFVLDIRRAMLESWSAI